MIDMTDPRNEYLVTHPHFLQGVEHGVETERERMIADLRNQYEGAAGEWMENPTNQEEKAFREGFIHAMIIALDLVEGENIEEE